MRNRQIPLFYLVFFRDIIIVLGLCILINKFIVEDMVTSVLLFVFLIFAVSVDTTKAFFFDNQLKLLWKKANQKNIKFVLRHRTENDELLATKFFNLGFLPQPGFLTKLFDGMEGMPNIKWTFVEVKDEKPLLDSRSGITTIQVKFSDDTKLPTLREWQRELDVIKGLLSIEGWEVEGWDIQEQEARLQAAVSKKRE